MPIVSFASYPDGFAGTKYTIEKMRELARKGKVNPIILRAARTVIRNCPEKDYESEGECIYNYVRQNVRYTRDPMDVELLQAPEVTLREASGDCDDVSILIASLAEAVGMEAAFLTIKANKNLPYDFTHVFPIIRTQKGWRGADPTVAHAYFGWIPPEATDPKKRKIWPV